MTPLFSACFLALFSVVILQSVSPISEKFKGVLTLASTLLFFLLFFRIAKPVFSLFQSFTELSENATVFSAVWKGLGIAFLISLCASFCRDLGEEGIASKLELCGKATILVLTIPFIEALLELMGGLLS